MTFLENTALNMPQNTRRNIKTALISAAFATALHGCATTPVLDTAAAPAGAYKLDPTHASVNWSLSHAGLSQYTARFDTISGKLDFDPDAPENSRLTIRIDPASVNTGLPKFDEELSTDGKYFDSGTHKDITFASTTSVKTGENTGRVTGNLTLKGVTKPITLDVNYNGAGKSFGNPGKTLGFSATGELTRSEFGMGYLTNFGIGDTVTLRIEAEFNEVDP